MHFSSTDTKGSDDRPTSECKIYSECDLLSSFCFSTATMQYSSSPTGEGFDVEAVGGGVVSGAISNCDSSCSHCNPYTSWKEDTR